jgi:holo-[acyl-carrier protein] synthase
MIVGLGIDLVTNSRVERELVQGEWQLGDGVFTSREIGRCNRGRRPTIYFAACFAAKEATLKALGIDVVDLGILREVEVDLGERGGSAVVLHDRMKSECDHLGVKHIRVTIASGKQQTGALVILES